VEIGPGLGFLTRFLSDSGAEVTAVELDSEATDDLRKLQLRRVNVIHGDFLRYDLGTVGDTIKLVGNVPYQITTPIVARIFGEIGQPQPWLSCIERVVLTVQLEVAQRLTASPGSSDYAKITLLVNYFARAKILHRLPADDFFPPPEVRSAVVELIPLKQPPIQCSNLKLLRQVVNAGFSQRRKMMKNNFSFLQADAADLNHAFESAGIDLQARAETLSLEQFARLTDKLAAIDMRVRNKQEQ
jgi:16S rRNA (adenine1518-N6/adenine1519-N6)-dimethyltransferase